MVFALVLGTCLGIYVCGNYIPAHPLFYVLFIAKFNLVAILLVILSFRTFFFLVLISTNVGVFVLAYHFECFYCWVVLLWICGYFTTYVLSR
jgi:hypothetical protein